MQPASQDPERLSNLYLSALSIAFLIVGIIYLFSRQASHRKHLKNWLIIIVNLFFCQGSFWIWGQPRSKIAREETDREVPKAEVGPGVQMAQFDKISDGDDGIRSRSSSTNE